MFRPCSQVLCAWQTSLIDPEPASSSPGWSWQPLPFISIGSPQEAYGHPVPCHTFLPILGIAVNRQQKTSLISTKKKRMNSRGSQFYHLCLFSHFSVMQTVVIQFVNVCLPSFFLSIGCILSFPFFLFSSNVA